MTKSQRMRESAVVISSTMPSAKYSCSGSPLMFWNGNTAIEGLSGSSSGRGESSFGPIAGMVRSRTRYARTGRGIFFTSCSPRSSNVQSSLSRTWSRTTRLIQIPPGSASASSRAATFTPSPKMSYSSTITSPRLIPIRTSNAPVLRSFRIALGHSALDFGRASYCVHHARELGKEAVAGVFHNSAPVFRDLRVDQFLEVRLQVLVCSLLIHPHQPRVPGNISREDCGETSGDGHLVSESRPPEADIHSVLVERPVLGGAPRLSCVLS